VVESGSVQRKLHGAHVTNRGEQGSSWRSNQGNQIHPSEGWKEGPRLEKREWRDQER